MQLCKTRLLQCPLGVPTLSLVTYLILSTLGPIASCQVSWECSSGDMVRALNTSDTSLLFTEEEYNRTFELESSMYGIYYIR